MVSALACVALALGCPSAQLEHSLDAAALYWRRSPEGARKLPCHGHITFRFAHLRSNAIARVPGCAITIDRGWWLIGDRSYWRVCGVVVHEVGHLVLGLRYFAASDPGDPAHSSDPRNVMYPTITALNRPAQCRR